VNKYYDYYQTWGAALSDLTGQGAQDIPKIAAGGLGGTSGLGAGMDQVDLVEARQIGYLFQTTVTGPRSHISRTVYVYLPPQYFQPAYKHYRFPGIELLHGSPGNPQTWVTVLGLIPTYLGLLNAHKADPAVLVMPDTDGGLHYGLQCLNDPGGLQDMTFVAIEVPEWIQAHLRVQSSGRAWGIAGYSEGGYCAANIGLQATNRFSYVGVLSGYFAPIKSQVPEGNKPNGRPHDINDFARYPHLELVNTPDRFISVIPAAVQLPSFFLAAGLSDPGDVQAAEYFRQLLLIRDANVPLYLVSGAGHQAKVWRDALTPMFEWMTPGLQLAAQEVKATPPPAVRKAHRAVVRKVRDVRRTVPATKKP
jgi:enterochelin esterase-like enzyme